MIVLDFKAPRMSSGSIIPHGIQEQWLKEEKEKEALKKQRRHDFIIATYGIIGGFISGLLSSILFKAIAG